MSDSSAMFNEDAAAERALHEGLRVPSLSAEAMQRIRRAVEREWWATVSAETGRVPTRRWLPWAVAASAALFAGVLGWNAFMAGVANDGAVLGEVARVDAPGIVEPRFLRSDVVVAQGASMHDGQTLEVRGDSLIALAGGGNLRVARASVIEVVGANAVRLERGELYVDIPPADHDSNRFTVLTPAGAFHHLGTQFAVAMIDGSTRLRVREGRVQWQAAEGDSTVDAGTEVVIDRDRKVRRRPISAAGNEWSWTESLAPGIDIENRPLEEFLDWFARETGRRLELADDSVRAQAASIRMHGNVRGLSPMEAMTAVIAATTLRFELPAGVIRVSSARDPRTPSN